MPSGSGTIHHWLNYGGDCRHSTPVTLEQPPPLVRKWKTKRKKKKKRSGQTPSPIRHAWRVIHETGKALTPSDFAGASTQGSGVKNNGQPMGTHPILFHLYQSLSFILLFLWVL
ncbi:hypothetical protein BDV30DRAFT_232312 [Aspergillus minisclerotigenes]|uniref:Uncharacterized protein n=1 Tax=Aspergillus minisclerotigenes TaxID=656917 RepID=A0A5N6IKC8_9EURO|nr:hypothetical protein BDV30DRAFT_232312 [Aspergillus minisclerotigenes]